MEAALDAGADDIVDHDDGSIEVITRPNDFVAVKDALGQASRALRRGCPLLIFPEATRSLKKQCAEHASAHSAH